jgi:hypothetical protein
MNINRESGDRKSVCVCVCVCARVRVRVLYLLLTVIHYKAVLY